MPYKEPEAARRYFREYHQRNKAEKLAYAKKYREANRESVAAAKARWYAEHKTLEILTKLLDKMKDIPEIQENSKLKKEILNFQNDSEKLGSRMTTTGVLSDRDKKQPRFSELKNYFE